MTRDPQDIRADALHASLIAGSREGLERAFSLFHLPIIASLARRPRFRGVDPQAVEDAFTDAVLAYVTNPRGFDPSRGRSLHAYLQFAAERNLLNVRRSETRRRGRQAEAARRAANSVELPSAAGNVLEKEDAARQAREHERALALLADPADRAVYDLRRTGERKTAAFAAGLGLGHLPADEQRRAVKRAKDRIDKVLARGLRGGTGGNDEDREARDG